MWFVTALPYPLESQKRLLPEAVAQHAQAPVAIAGCQVWQAGTSPAPALGMGAVPRSSSGGNRDNLG